VALIGTDAECARRLAVEVAPSLMAAAADLHAEAQQVLAPATYRRDASALTLREIEVLRLAALGLSCLESGKALGITPRTVEFHLKNAGEKLGAVNKIHAVAIAVSAGWISLS
jgi:DNA-binding CsgD family transcriptional regulator